MRRLPGPADCRLSDGDQTPEAPLGLFRDWQRTQTQSSVKAPLEVEAANGCPVLRKQEPPPRGTRCALAVLKGFDFARSSVARIGRIVFSLDNDLHGRRRSGRLSVIKMSLLSGITNLDDAPRLAEWGSAVASKGIVNVGAN